MNNAWTERIAEQQTEIERLMGSTFPELIAKLKEENTKLRAFWEWSRLADKMTFEQYHWIGKKANHEG